MNSDRKEAFRQWTAISISGMALVITCLRGPLSLTFRATVEDVLRQELARHPTSAAADARTLKSQELAHEALLRLESELTAIHVEAARNEAAKKGLVEINNCLFLLESRLESMEKEILKERADRKPPILP